MTAMAAMTKNNKPVKIDAAEAKRRVLKMLPILRKAYPEAKVSLDFSTPLELLIATILAAQCTDARVNIVTKDLFQKYRKAEDWVKVSAEELENDIRSTGFTATRPRAFRRPARRLSKHLTAACRRQWTNC
jgi:endonuclease-3